MPPAKNIPAHIDSPGLRAQADKLRDLAAESQEGPLRTALMQIVAWYEKTAAQIEEDHSA